MKNVQIRCNQFPVNSPYEIRPEKLLTVQTGNCTCCRNMTGFRTGCDSGPMFSRDIKYFIAHTKLTKEECVGVVGGQNSKTLLDYLTCSERQRLCGFISSCLWVDQIRRVQRKLQIVLYSDAKPYLKSSQIWYCSFRNSPECIHTVGMFGMILECSVRVTALEN